MRRKPWVFGALDSHQCFHSIFPLRMNLSLCSRDSSPYTDNGCMDSREERSRGGPPRTARIPRVNRKFYLHGISPESPHLSSWGEVCWFQTPIQTGKVRHANVPWMIHIFGSGLFTIITSTPIHLSFGIISHTKKEKESKKGQEMFLMSNQTKNGRERYHSNVVSGCLSPCSWISNFLECSKFHLSTV
jgi:hypothetical protein